MIIKLKRFSYGEYETEGVLIISGRTFATIEQPWTPNPNGSDGGKPYESCVPDGIYNLTPFKRPSGAEVFMLHNEDLGVYKYPQDHEAGYGRNLCIIHVANWARQVQGCIAPGLARLPMVDTKGGDFTTPVQAVSSSGAAMRVIRDLLGDGEHLLCIESNCGARDKKGQTQP